MNYRQVANQLGLLLVVFSLALASLALIAWLLDLSDGHEVNAAAQKSLLVAAGTCLVIGGLVWALTRGTAGAFFGRREALLLVGMSWLIGAVFAALPFLIWARFFGEAPLDHPFRGIVNCYFEAMSGLTTTGATVLSDIESIPRELLLWRAFTHWVGGLGIVVLFVAVLPSLGVGGKKLFQVESPGPSATTLQPRVRDTARILWYIYVGLTLAEILALSLGAGMHVFDSVCHTFATVATGGFSTRNASLGAYYNQSAVDVIVIVFMVLAGANFGLYHQLWRGRVRTVFRDTELRVYLAMLVFASAVIMMALTWSDDPLVLTRGGEPVPSTAAASFRQSVATTVSIQTTTGFCTSDFDRWPFIAHAALLALMFTGGCSGSTAGGIKVIRVWIVVKSLFVETGRYARPHVLRPVRINGVTVDRSEQFAAISYVGTIIILFVLGWLAIMLIEQSNSASECSSVTAATASVATLCTIGPGLDGVGAMQNYGWFSSPSKLVMCLLMAMGRLEVSAILVLFMPHFWRKP